VTHSHPTHQRRCFATGITHRTTDQLLSELRLHHIGFVFQTFNLLSGNEPSHSHLKSADSIDTTVTTSGLTALENVELPMVLAGDKVSENDTNTIYRHYHQTTGHRPFSYLQTAEQRRTKAIELLTRVGMEKRLDHLPSQLSGISNAAHH